MITKKPLRSLLYRTGFCLPLAKVPRESRFKEMKKLIFVL